MKIFCSGIGGIGLSAYACHMKERGHKVSGTDAHPSALTQELQEMGISISHLQDGSAVPKDADLFVYSEAIPEDSPERLKAKEYDIRQISYFSALGELTKNSHLICISGTHGKSSTTAMLAGVLIDAGKDPNVVIGTKSQKLGGKNWRKSDSNLWVVEACEYRKSFHALHPKMILLTNADGDHFDAFKSHDDYKQAFIEFVKQLPPDGILIHHASDPDTRDIVHESHRSAVDADAMPLLKLSVPGLHMRQNAQLVLAAAEELSIDQNTAQKSLQKFSGTWRRMETKRMTKLGTIIIDDYAHHPKEIVATLSALREAHPTKKIVCIFQPHTHDRTLRLWPDFTQSFHDANVVILAGVYDARPVEGAEKVDLKKFGEEISARSTVKVFVMETLGEAKKLAEKEGAIHPGDIVVTMGAGDITTLSDSLDLP